MNYIWRSDVTVSNSSRANCPFSPQSAHTDSSTEPVSTHPRASGQNAQPRSSGVGQSIFCTGSPLRRTGEPVQKID